MIDKLQYLLRTPSGVSRTDTPVLQQVFKWSQESRFRTAPSVIPWSLYIASRELRCVLAATTPSRKDL